VAIKKFAACSKGVQPGFLVFLALFVNLAMIFALVSYDLLFPKHDQNMQNTTPPTFTKPVTAKWPNYPATLPPTFRI